MHRCQATTALASTAFSLAPRLPQMSMYSPPDLPEEMMTESRYFCASLGGFLFLVGCGSGPVAGRAEAPPGGPLTPLTGASVATPQTLPAAPTHAEARGGAMSKIQGDTFVMGSDEEDNEKPPHRTKVASFEMDDTEVTVGAYRLCVDGGGCSATGLNELDNCNWGKPARLRHPINCVDWEQADAFCKWAGKRLPREEEWEFAARGSSGKRFPWGNVEPSNQLCWARSLGEDTCVVGSYPAGNTSAGLMDMAGNVWEWTASLHCPYTSAGFDTGRCNPDRVIRGGGWTFTHPVGMRGTNRGRAAPPTRSLDLGFRCARGLLSASRTARGPTRRGNARPRGGAAPAERLANTAAPAALLLPDLRAVCGTGCAGTTHLRPARPPESWK